MSHYAKIENGIVVRVNVVSQERVNTYDGTWVQTSYNTKNGVHYGQDGEPDGGVALRYNYAGVGYLYNKDNDVFYAPQPYISWTLDTDTWQWVCPLTYPDDDKMYYWDEDVYQADNTKGWITNE
jgi:hypothetical protein